MGTWLGWGGNSQRQISENALLEEVGGLGHTQLYVWAHSWPSWRPCDFGQELGLLTYLLPLQANGQCSVRADVLPSPGLALQHPLPKLLSCQ